MFRCAAPCPSELQSRRPRPSFLHERPLGAGTRVRPPSLSDPVLSVFSAISDTTVLWRHIIQRHGGVITNTLNISCLAKVSDGFTQGHVVQAVRSVLTDRRLRQQPRKPLVAVEFVAALSSQSPVYQEEEDSFKVRGASGLCPPSPGAPELQGFELCHM